MSTYLKFILACVLSLGIFLPILAFIPATDDFGNPIVTSLPSKIVTIVLGLLSFSVAVYICIPSLVHKRFREEKIPTSED